MPKLADLFNISVDELMYIKTTSKQKDGIDINSLCNIIFKALALAMGVATIVLSILGNADTKSLIIMLGFGISALGIVSFHEDLKNHLD